MNAKAINIPTPFTFQVGKNDLGPLFFDSLKLKCSNFSPLAGALSSYVAGSNKPSAARANINQDPQVLKAASILADPVVRMINRTGGGAMPVSHFTACYNPGIDDQAFAVVTPSFEGSYLIQLFDSPWHYLGWWLVLNASEVGEPIGNYMPPPIRFESLVYMLHTIDAYRRCAFESMLDYTPAEQASIKPAEFIESMQQSIRSRDLRWLLPAFIGLIPNLNVSSFDGNPEFISALAKYDFLLPARDTETQEDIFVFGEAGKIMGVEFHRTWVKSIGFEIAASTPKGWRVMHRGFLAPTGFTNHLFILAMDAGGNCFVNHQAMDRHMLDHKLANLLAAVLNQKDIAEDGLHIEKAVPFIKETEIVQPVEAVSIPSAARPATPDKILCKFCGTNNDVDALFCKGCGQPVPKKELEQETTPKISEQSKTVTSASEKREEPKPVEKPKTEPPAAPRRPGLVVTGAGGTREPSPPDEETTSPQTAAAGGQVKSRLEATQKELDTCKLNLSKLEVRHKVGELSEEQYSESNKKLRAQIQELENTIAELKKQN